MIHSGKFNISPSAGLWLRTYMILPTEVKSTCPKGYILRGDILAHITYRFTRSNGREGGGPSN
jgi:hypothetical protein